VKFTLSHDYCTDDVCVAGGPCEFPDGGEEEVVIPSHMEVCERCEGRGKVDHEAFSNGISQDSFDEDPDFREDYFNGVYDVLCPECRGHNVVEEPDDDLTPRQQAAWDQRYPPPDPAEEAERRYFAMFERD
jgi:hypothetical protein